jgi:1-acyl-sn-glycerol-3-phosphate acyltransferase
MQYTIFDAPVLSTLLRLWARTHLKLFGWRREGTPPDIPKYVVIAAPHTTNWELPTAIMAAFAFRIKIYWMGKDSLFRFPFGGLFRWLGGIPVNRSKSTGLVARTVEAFDENNNLVIVMAPEGTRSKTGNWRSGFYHIARGAGVPIVLAFLDYRRKVVGIGPAVEPTGDIDADMGKMRRFYADITGKHPEKSSRAVVKLKNA